MTTMEFPESRGGGRDARNLASVPEDGELHAATKNIWPWQPCNYEAKRVILRSVYLEKPLRMAPVCGPQWNFQRAEGGA